MDGIPEMTITEVGDVSPASDLVLCKKDKLCVLGTAGSLPAAPFDDDSFEIWGVSVVQSYEVAKRWDVLFEMHGRGYVDRPDVKKRLKTWDGPMYMLDKHEDFPNSIVFPKWLVDKHRAYHTTSISYMLSLALHSFEETGKPFHVSLMGVHMEHQEEYTEQRPCCEYWLGRMEGAGMDVFVHPSSALLKSQGLYGYENYHPVCYDLKQRIAGLAAGEQHWRGQEAEMHDNAMQQVGAQKEANYWLSRFQKGQIPTAENPVSTGVGEITEDMINGQSGIG